MKKLYLLLLCMIVVAFSSYAQLPNHPGHFSSIAELNFFKSKVVDQKEPWLSAYNAMRASAQASLTYRAEPYADVYITSQNRTPAEFAIERDGGAVYIQALMWYITGNTQYATNAMNIMNAWATTLRSYTGDDEQKLVAGWSFPGFARGAEIIKNTYPGWDPAVGQRFIQMWDTFMYPIIKDGSANWVAYNPNWATEPHNGHAGNWAFSKIEALTAMAIFKNDKPEFDRVIALWKQKLPLYTTSYGKEQETCRDFHHVQLALGSMVSVAEYAYHQGIDLYAELDNRLLKTLEYSATVLNGKTPSPAPGCSVTRTTFHPSAWEVAYNHYRNRKGLNMPETQALLSRNRPDGFDRSWGWGSLTHQQLSVVSAGPVASFTASVVSGTEPLTVNFNASASSAPSGRTISSYAWSFGNGNSATGVSTSQTYNAGTYTVTLTVTDNTGATASSLKTITAVETGNKLAVTAAIASASENTTNTPDKAIDGNLATRWSADGNGAWIRLDLGAASTVKYVKAAFFNGDTRRWTFDVETSNDGSTFTPIATNLQTSGTTNNPETFNVPNTNARYVRFVGRGNSASTWNSPTELEVWGTAGTGGGPVTLINEPFTTSPAPFTKTGGTWTVTGGKYQLTNPVTTVSPNGNIAVHNTTVSGDFTLTADASAPATTGTWDDFSIIFNYQNSTNYYAASFSESSNTTTSGIEKVVNGVVTELADITALIAGGTTYNIKIEKTGSTIKVYRNGTLVATATDATFTGGFVGIATYNNNATFDNLIVTAPGTSGALSNIAAPGASLNMATLNADLDSKTSLLKVFSNPTSGLVNLRVDASLFGANMTVYNTAGAVVLNKRLGNSAEFQFDLSDKPNGVYLISVTKGAINSKSKIIKE